MARKIIFYDFLRTEFSIQFISFQVYIRQPQLTGPIPANTVIVCWCHTQSTYINKNEIKYYCQIY